MAMSRAIAVGYRPQNRWTRGLAETGIVSNKLPREN